MTQRPARFLAALAITAAMAGCQSEPADPPAETAATATPVGAPASTAAPTPAPTETTALTCDYPVKLGSTVAAVRSQFGADATVGTMTGAEGVEYKALVLWAKDPTRRLELGFDGEAKDPVVGSVDIASDKAHWRVRGLALGDSLARVREVNGTPFKLSGFDWDYGGWVNDWQKGTLEPQGRCGVVVRFRPGDDVGDDYASGDSVFGSDDPKVGKAKAVVDALGVNQLDPE